jgi:hypothetical protein
MSYEASSSEHHLFGVQSNNSIQHYSSNSNSLSAFDKANLNIWKLKKIFSLLSLHLALCAHKKPQQSSREELRLIWSTFERLNNRQAVAGQELQKVAIILLQLGPSHFLKEMQKFQTEFSPALTPQFRDILRLMDFTSTIRDELLFHPCNPDIYVWRPSKDLITDKMLVVFLTRSNTLNMPRPLAHLILARLRLPIMYISNRPNIKPNEFIVGHNDQETTALILKIADSFGISKLYGLGASYGGYKACQLASGLNFERVLNFSGAQADSEKTEQIDATSMARDYDLEKILSVLSETDSIDQRIRAAYDRDGFITPRSWLTSKSHGSFTSSFIEGSLKESLDWLIA